MSNALRLRAVGLGKHFGGVHAVADVDLELRAGEIQGLVGANGAGKSTLLRCLAGAHPADAGRIEIDGREVRLRTPRDAQALGIETVYQDLALADHLDAVANLFLGRELTRFGLLDEGRMEREAREVVAQVNPAVTAFRSPVHDLSGGQRQAVAMARALRFDARVLLLDEPTAALGPGETAAVLDLLRDLRARGLAVLVVSHDLGAVLELADRITVMRTGRVVARLAHGEATAETVLGHMLGTAEREPGAADR